MGKCKIYSSAVTVYKYLMVQWSESSTDATRGNKREREARDTEERRRSMLCLSNCKSQLAFGTQVFWHSIHLHCFCPERISNYDAESEHFHQPLVVLIIINNFNHTAMNYARN